MMKENTLKTIFYALIIANFIVWGYALFIKN